TLVPASAFPSEREDIESFFSALTTWRGDAVGLNPGTLEKARKLVAAEWPQDPPKILDSFAGAGTIPLEALRLGAKAYGVELNPVAFLVALGTTVWPQQFGPSLSNEVRRWAAWVREHTYTEVARLYPELEREDGYQAATQLAMGDHPTDQRLKPVAY